MTPQYYAREKNLYRLLKSFNNDLSGSYLLDTNSNGPKLRQL